MPLEDIFAAANDVVVDVACVGFMTHAEYTVLLGRLETVRPKGTASRGPTAEKRVAFFVKVADLAGRDLTTYFRVEERRRGGKATPAIAGHGHWRKPGHKITAKETVLSETEFTQLLPAASLVDAQCDVRVGFSLNGEKCQPIQSLPIEPEDPSAIPYDQITGQRYVKLSGNDVVYNVIVEVAPEGWWVCVSFTMQGRVNADLLRSTVKNGARIAGLFVRSRAT